MIDWEIIPTEWRFCKISSNKNPFEKDWPKKLYKRIKLGGSVKAAGVICGPGSGGLICLDIDGPDAEKKLEGFPELPKTVSWTSGRPHRQQRAFWAYEEDWELLHTTHLLKGVPGQELVLKWEGQQSVVVGHHPKTGGYDWINSPEDCEIAIAPDWLTDLMARPKAKPTAPDDELDAFLNGDHDLAISLLSQIPTDPYAEDYNSWLKVGAALNAVSKATGADLYQAWVDWSLKANNVCSNEEYEYKWESFQRSPGDADAVGLGTLMFLVDEAAEDDSESDTDQNGENLNVSWDEIKNWYYVANENKYCHIRTPTDLLPPININTRFKKLDIPKVTDRIKKAVDCVNWYPGKPIIYIDEGRKVLNLHRSYSTGQPGDVSRFVQLVTYCYPKEAELLFDFMAFTLQRPDQKINFAPYMVGTQGIGKNFIWEPMKRVLKGEFHCIHNDNRSTQYNEYLLGRKLVIIDEPMNMGLSRFAIANELKGLIASTGEDDRLHINGKYRAYVEQVHLTNFVILTNFSDAIKIKDERRFYPCFSAREPMEDSFYDSYNQWLGQGGSEAVVNWLFERDLSQFNPKVAPMATESLEDILQDSETEVGEAITDFIEKYEVVSFQECRAIVKHLLGSKGVDLITRNVIQECGFTYQAGRSAASAIRVKGEVVKYRPVYDSNQFTSEEAKEALQEYIQKYEKRPFPDILKGDPPMF